MMKSVSLLIKKSLADNRTLIWEQLHCRRLHQEMKSLPRIISDANSSMDEFQYFSMKIKDLMDKEQLEYFENVIRKVENIDHPVAELMRAKLHNPMFDLIMNLTTKMVNNGKEISSKQQNLSNAIQLIHIGNIVHQNGIYDLSKVPNFGNSLPADSDLILGNKIALLAGDFLLANAQIKITQMRDDEVLKIISSAMCDIIDSNFIGNHDKSDKALPFKPGKIPDKIGTNFEHSTKPVKLKGTSGTAEDEWMIRQIIHRGFLIAKGCQASAVLAKQPIGIQKNCFELGKYFHLTCQAFVEKESFKLQSISKDVQINLVSAPVLFHLHHEPSLYDKILLDLDSPTGIDNAELYNKISNGPGVEETEKLMKKLKDKTRQQLENFQKSEEKTKIETVLNDFV